MTDSQEILAALIGTNGTGKSTQIALMVSAYVKKGGRALIVTPDDSEWRQIPELDITNTKELTTFKGTRRTIFFDEETFPNIIEHYRNGMLVFDDARFYVGLSIPQGLLKLLIRRRQYHLNTVFVAHGFTDLPKKLFTYVSHIILFETKDNMNDRKNSMRDFPKMEAAKRRIDAKARTQKHYCEIIKQ